LNPNEDLSNGSKRQVAYKVRIEDLLRGSYVEEEGWTPNYLSLDDGRHVSRVNVIGTVVAEDEQGVVLDDGTGTISVRSFDGELRMSPVGHTVLVIARPRVYSGETYLALEIMKELQDTKWIEVRQLELQSVIKQSVETVVKTAPAEETIEAEVVEITSDTIVDFIRAADEGEGVDFQKIVDQFKDENLITKLLGEGELFEIKPGKLKVLE